MQKMLNFLEKGIKKYSKEHTAQTLGDRRLYIGGSDLGRCELQVLKSKFVPIEHSLSQEVIFFRGHCSEGFIKKAFEGNGFENFSEQVEVAGLGDDKFLKAHLDFVAHFEKEDVLIEVKSTGSLIDTPRESWIHQTMYGIGLARMNGMKINRGYIVAMDLNTGNVKIFNILFDENIFEMCLNEARHLYNLLKNKDLSACKTKISPLCSSCSFSKECSAFGGEKTLSLGMSEGQDFLTFAKVNEDIKSLNNAKKTLQSKLSSFFRNTEVKKVIVGNKIISYSFCNGREDIDKEKLKLLLGDDDYQSVLTKTNGYEKFTVTSSR